ncbi:MAG TPA: beta-ketoacyl-ACP synthase III [Polyangia bacterium]|nr:beta-ketoacyl-ACP synthase III [Polyangia bacterium]
MQRSKILGTGSFLPDRVVTNEWLSSRIDTSAEWIVERTGIHERRWVEPGSGVGSSDLGVEAARRALADARLEPSEIDLVIFGTLSPDHDFPGNGVFLQRKMGLRRCATLDIRQQCSGFISGLAMADAFVRAGQYRHVLVVCAEVQSTGLDVSDRGRDMTVIFADGAGAAVIGPAADDSPGRILSTHLHTDGEHAEELWCEFPSSLSHPRLTEEAIAAGRHYPRMVGRVVFRHAAQRMPEAVREALDANGHSIDDLALLVPHQANRRIIELVQRSLGLPDEKVALNVDRYGNTTGATIPIALDEARRSGRVKAGDLVCLTAFGAGFTWGACLLRL